MRADTGGCSPKRLCVGGALWWHWQAWTWSRYAFVASFTLVYTVNVSRYISITVYKLVMRLSDMVDL